jgi:ribosomal silencing factor RsfS
MICRQLLTKRIASNPAMLLRWQRTLSTTPAWKWVPPPVRAPQTLEEEANDQTRESIAKASPAKPIQTVKGVHLTAEEVIDAFVLNGAENVVQKPCGQLADAMVIATGRSSMHAKMLAELIVKSTKARRLKLYNPSKPIEGEQDWFLVDTGKLLIHVFGDYEIRKNVGLEAHLDALMRRKKEDAAFENVEDVIEPLDDEFQSTGSSRLDTTTKTSKE